MGGEPAAFSVERLRQIDRLPLAVGAATHRGGRFRGAGDDAGGHQAGRQRALGYSVHDSSQHAHVLIDLIRHRDR